MVRVIFRNIKNILLGWCIFAPAAMLVPKNKKLVLFMGRVQGKFFGNVKYMYLYVSGLKAKDAEPYFFTEHKNVYDKLKEHNLPVVYHPSLKSYWLLLRANIIFAASTVWIKKCKYHLLCGAKKIQIFHGIALKKVELGIAKRRQYNESRSGRLDNAIRGRFLRYDLVVSTSKYCSEKLFAPSFNHKAIFEGGFPRNDIFFNDEDEKLSLLGTDTAVIEKIEAFRQQGKKTVLYAPTFRDTGGDALSDKILDLDKLNRFGAEQNLVFVFKFHLSTDLAEKLGSYENILVCDNTADIQPILKVSDILITDYSSVCIDYLLLDRPMVFFVYDYEKYIEKDRQLLFDYDWVTAGPKCRSQQQLENALADYAGGKDEFTSQRTQIRDLMFDNKDGNSAERIWDFVKHNYLTQK